MVPHFWPSARQRRSAGSTASGAADFLDFGPVGAVVAVAFELGAGRLAAGQRESRGVLVFAAGLRWVYLSMFLIHAAARVRP